jgi:SAM-dependent methyltransferase
MKYKITKNCQICNNKLLDFLDLGKQPLCDDLTKKPDNSVFLKLQVSYCKKCLTAFQKYNVERNVLFPKNYHYRSANTNDVVEGLKDLVKSSKKYYLSLKDKIVLDIGCNDGTLLSLFKKEGCKTFGIEPTAAFKEAKKKGHQIINKYFDLKTAQQIKKKIKNIDIITFTNVFAHIDDLKNLLASLKFITNKNTLIIIENHYLGEVIKKNQFDTFYHEHQRTYSLQSFVSISKLLKTNIIDYKFVKRYNGNIRVYLSKTNKIYKTRKNIKDSLKTERTIIKKIKVFQKKVDNWKYSKKLLLNKLVKQKGALPAKAFPGRASILINLLKLDAKYISNIYEKNYSLKVNNYAPGTNIRILKEKYITTKEIQKDIMINFAWHISSEIKNYVRKKLKYKGRIIDLISKSDFK